VASDEVWLFGFNNPRSWDSRYFGPVPVANVMGTLSPVVRW
jgi:type IV secretory pathway protease TraF